jgi:hypothetical protein
MKPVLIKKWQTDIAKAQSAQRDKGIKTYHACHIMLFFHRFIVRIFFPISPPC